MGYPNYYSKYNLAVTGKSITEKLMQILSDEEIVKHVKSLNVRNNINSIGGNVNETSSYVSVDVSFDDASTLAKVQVKLHA